MEAIGLNPIRLDAIGIDPIRLNAIRLGVPGASSGSNRPYIDPEVLASLVAVCICDGKSNNDPDRAVIKNLVDPANPFVISNAAYKLNSGFGKYEEDFTSWIKYPNVETDGFNIWVNSIFDSDWLLYRSVNTSGIKATKIRVTGIPQNGAILYHYIKNSDDVERTTLIIEKDGIYELPKSFIIKGSTITVGFQLRTPQILDYTKIKVEQIPSFQGALVTDGVNDLITSTKSVQEMLGGSNEITVVSMIHQIEANVNNLTNTNNIRVGSSFIRNSVVNVGKTGIYGYTFKNTVSLINNILGDKNDYTAQGDLTGTSAKFSVEGMIEGSTISQTSQVAWYWNFISKKSLTTDQINQVIAYYNLDKYVKPDIYYDVKRQGLSNNTPDADWYLKDFSDNGRDMQLYNYGKTPESGINEEGGLQSDGITDYGKAENLPIYKDYTVVADREIVDGLINNADGGVATRGTKWDTGAFCFDYTDGVYSFGATNGYVDRVKPNRFISYMSKYIHNGITTPVGDAVDNNPLCIAKLGSSIDRYSKLALWSFLLFPYSLSEFLLERQLKRHKLGTLYPDMVEFRPIIKSNVSIDKYYFINKTTNKQLNIGDYFAITDTIEIQICLTDKERQEIASLTVNGKEFTPTFTDTRYLYHIENFGELIGKKSPQKINIAINEYVRYEDIVQPYPTIFRLIDIDSNKEYTYGDKLKVGTKVKIASVKNLLPELYSPVGTGVYNGNTAVSGNIITVEKTMAFGWSRPFTYLKDNEPNCILAPQILRIPNASYKILGYIPDLTGKGNHGKINNSAYAGMSGVNGYKYDWSNWIKYADGKLSDNSFVMNTSATMATTKLFSPQSYAIGDKSYSFRFKISGLINNQRIEIDYPKDSDGNAITSDYLSNGEYYTKDYTIGEVQRLNFFLINANIREPVNIKIEQIGEYEGSFCLDGVEDFITIPTLSHGAKQVLMKVRSLKPVCPIYEQRTLTGVDGSWVPTFCIFMNNQAIAYADGNNGNTYIDGILNTSIQGKQLVNITHNITVTNENTKFGNTQSPLIGKLATSDTLYAQMALFSFMSFPEISSEEEIKELNDIVGIEGGYVESPDYYWDAYGKSNNLDEDIDLKELGLNNARSMILDKSIEGLEAIEHYKNTGSVVNLSLRRLSLNNFAFNEESGYVDNGLVSDGVEDNLKNANMPVLTDYTWIMKRKRLNDKALTILCHKGEATSSGAFLFEYIEGGINTRSFGATTNVTFPDLISYQTKNSYNGQSISVGSNVDGTQLRIFMGGDTYPYYTKAVFYKAMLYSKTIDMLSINMLKNLFAKDELIDVNNPIFKK